MNHLDGDTQSDFLNLNQGKAVDTTHIFSLKLRKEAIGGKNEASVKTAAEAARLLNDNVDSPFHKSVRFDDTEKAPLTLKTLCATGTSDLSTSLVGVVRAGEVDAAGAASLIEDVFRTLHSDAPELLRKDYLLAPPVNGGKRGTATMMAGVAACLGYMVRGRAVTADDRARLVAAVKETLSGKVDGNLSGQRKRELMKKFAAAFFTDTSAKHHGVPVALIDSLSASAFGLTPMKKKAEPKRRVPKQDVAQAA